jgi:hypothetical protein
MSTTISKSSEVELTMRGSSASTTEGMGANATMVPVGLSNEPVVFMCLMNDIFREYLDKFAIVFLDEILIYSKSEEKHEKNLRMVLQVLREH